MPPRAQVTVTAWALTWSASAAARSALSLLNTAGVGVWYSQEGCKERQHTAAVCETQVFKH